MAGVIRVGVGGWVFEPWRENFYPEGLRQKDELAYAASRLGTIEINATYYGSQKRESFARWASEVPEDFRFSVKGSRFCTNRRILAEAAGSVEKFFAQGVGALGEKLGPINWQVPATKRFEAEDFEDFLKLLPRSIDGVPLRHAIEARSETFADARFLSLAQRYGVAVVMAADSDFPLLAAHTADFAFVRIMGTREGEAEGYPPEALDGWARRLEVIARGELPDDFPRIDGAPQGNGAPAEVFVYVIDGNKPANPAAAMALIARLPPVT
ncbi:Uncharacterized conserved protein YecE, DUF72 family [Devosia enhydra]|uniref:Uncharacterized conserved protein YecE, DUF72 family n=1 Tax=Devosia enhydra TaxID=665118 RepID=A0A1K2I2M6_9HYPH|nr:DUF72 domain-containing protein [Devosia enhydra]SFZ86584.1 Uncharacterized conserved protein YecE, DUF72 family [Devosia enhydra]